MSRVRSIARALAMVTLVLVILMFIPPVRHVLTLGFLPRLWRDVSTYRLIKVHMNSVSSTTLTPHPMATLVPCTQPARAASDITGHHNPLMRLLTSEPLQKIRARPQDEAAYSRAWTWLNQSAERRQRYHGFAPGLTPLQKAQMVLTWRVLHEALTLHNITHFLISGSLMGAVRHGGIIPWDDDMDIAVDEEDLDKVKHALSCVPGYTLRITQQRHWKFFAENGHVMKSLSKARIRYPPKLAENEKKDYVLEWHPTEDVAARSPFVDVFLMTHDDSYAWCVTRFNIQRCLYRLEDTYPLTQVNFEGYPAPAPRRSAFIVNSMYNANICTSSSQNHFDGIEITERSAIPCGELSQMHTVYYVS